MGFCQGRSATRLEALSDGREGYSQLVIICQPSVAPKEAWKTFEKYLWASFSCRYLPPQETAVFKSACAFVVFALLDSPKRCFHVGFGVTFVDMCRNKETVNCDKFPPFAAEKEWSWKIPDVGFFVEK